MTLWTKIILGSAVVGIIAAGFGYQKLAEYLLSPLMLTMTWWVIKRGLKEDRQRRQCQNCLNINPRSSKTCSNCGSNALELVQT